MLKRIFGIIGFIVYVVFMILAVIGVNFQPISFICTFGSLLFGLLLAYLPSKQNQITNKESNSKQIIWAFSIINLILMGIFSICIIMLNDVVDILNIFKLPVISPNTSQNITNFFTTERILLTYEEVADFQLILSMFQIPLLLICIIDLFIKNHREKCTTRKVYGLYFIIFYFLVQCSTLVFEGRGVLVEYLSDTFRIHNIIVDETMTFTTKVQNIHLIVTGNTEKAFGIKYEHIGGGFEIHPNEFYYDY